MLEIICNLMQLNAYLNQGTSLVRSLLVLIITALSVIACSPYNPVKMAGSSNPLPNTDEVMAAGKLTFEQRCQACHGAEGRGDGAAARALNLHPSNLRLLDNKLEGLIAMRIARGGNGMPAWEDVLREDEIWQLTRYIKKISQDEAAQYVTSK